MKPVMAPPRPVPVGKFDLTEFDRPTRPSKSKNSNNDTDNDSGVPVSDPNWQWSRFELLEDQYGRTEMRKIEATVAEADNGPFMVIYHKRMGMLWPDVVEVTLTSTPLKKALQQHFPTNGDLYSVTKPKIMGRDLFVVLQSLKNHLAQIHETSESGNIANVSSDGGPQVVNGGKTEDGHSESTEPASIKEEEAKVGASENGSSSIKEEDLQALHLKHLVRFLETEYKEEIGRDRRMKEEKRVSWDMLWTFLKKGTKVAYHCDHTDELLCGVVANNKFTIESQSQSQFPTLFRVELDVWNFDGKLYKPCQIRRHIRNFQGERSFEELPIAPVEILSDTSRLDADFLANGRRFNDLAMRSPNRYMLYTGPMFQIRCGALSKTKSDGRVMIDLTSFAAMNPDYYMGNARAPTTSKYSYSSFKDGRPLPPPPKLLAPMPKYPPPMPKYSGDKYIEGDCDLAKMEIEEASEESLIFAPAIVFGFSFELKEWGSFAVSGFSDIIFNTKAFDELTMDPGKKLLIHNLVGQYISPPSDQDDSKGGVVSGRRVRVDPIAKKGEGCIFLCYGPPGTGKTLTAESIAEKMKKPLWSLSVSELGTNPRELEQRLVKVLEIAAKWHAVLLLDEADVYLEKRSTGDVLRNSMTGVFLRLLEYYQGVLFLTTNRIKTFDDAFRSRISLFVHYPSLGKESKAKIWNTMLTRVNATGVSETFCEEMAEEEMNGREIRNAIHMAQVWASSNGEVLDVRHVQHVTGILADSSEDLSHSSGADYSYPPLSFLR